MALTIVQQFSTANTADVCTSIITDDTTGVWDVVTNTTGYQAEAGDASGNAKRSELALYIFVTKKEYPGADSSIVYVNDETTADTIARWTITGIAVDGWFRVRLLGFPIWDSGTAYLLDQIVWYNDDLYIVTAALTTAGQAPDGAGAADWDTASVPTLTTIYDNVGDHDDTSTIYLSELDLLQVCLSNAGFADLVADNSKDNCCSDCGSENEQLLCKVRSMLEGAKVAAARARFLQGEQKILVVTDLLAGKDCFACK